MKPHGKAGLAFALALAVLCVVALFALVLAVRNKNGAAMIDNTGSSAEFSVKEALPPPGRKLTPRPRTPAPPAIVASATAGQQPAAPAITAPPVRSTAIGSSNAADKLEWTFKRDAEGRLLRLRDPGGKETHWDYETFRGEPKRIKKATRHNQGGEVVYQCDELGRRTSMKDGSGMVRYEWDPLGPLKSVQREGGSRVDFEHDAFGRLRQYSLGAGAAIGVSYDFLGRIETMTTPAGAVTYEHHPGQGKTIRTLPNKVRTIWEREPNGRLISITHVDASNQVIVRYSYRYSPEGLIAQITEERSTSEQRILGYEYDQVQRLVAVTDSSGKKWQAEYDPMGNRTKAGLAGGPAAQSVYDWASRLISLAGEPCAHDSSGNLTRTILNGKVQVFAFDPDNRLRVVNGGEVRYQFDGDGCLIARTVRGETTTFTPDPTTDIWRPLAATTSAGKRTLYLWEGRHPFGTIEDGRVAFFLEDHLGSARHVIDQSGKVTGRKDYSPFGTMDAAPAGAELTPGFAGLFFDGVASLHLTRARAYNSELGRFLQPDPQHRIPSGSQKNLSLYSYCGNDYVNFVDLNGAEAESAEHLFDWTYPIGQLLNFYGSRIEPSYWIGANHSGATFSYDKDKLDRFPLGPTTVAAVSRNDQIAKWHDIQDWVNWHASVGTEVKVPVGPQQFQYFISQGRYSDAHNHQVMDYLIHPNEGLKINRQATTKSPIDLAVLLDRFPTRKDTPDEFVAKETREFLNGAAPSLIVSAADFPLGERPGLWSKVSPYAPYGLWMKDAADFAAAVRDNPNDPFTGGKGAGFGLSTISTLAGETFLGASGGAIGAGLSASLTIGETGRSFIMQDRAMRLAGFGGAMIGPGTMKVQSMGTHGGGFEVGGNGYDVKGGWTLESSRHSMWDRSSTSHLWANTELRDRRLQDGTRISGIIRRDEMRTEAGGNLLNLYGPQSETIHRYSRDRLQVAKGLDNSATNAPNRKPGLTPGDVSESKFTDRGDSSKSSKGKPPQANQPPPFFPPPPPQPSPVGGVYLGGAGRSLAGLQQLRGISLDAGGNFILLAEDGGDIRLPPLRLDDVVTIFRSVYLHGQGPSVTINPDRNNPHGATMDVVHGKGTQDTYAGWILYQADRIMKGYNLGKDNISKVEINSKVSGYTDVLRDIFSRGNFADGRNQGGNWERFWILPSGVNRYRGASRELTIFDVPLRVKTQKMVMKNGTLEDDPNGKSSKGALTFTDWFTRNYDLLSEECLLLPPPETGIAKPVPVFAELRRIALITAIAEHTRHQLIPLPDWMREYEVPKVPIDPTTPSLTNDMHEASIYGGVNLSPADDVVRSITSQSDLKSLPEASQEQAGRQLALANTLAPVLEKAARGREFLVPFAVQTDRRQFHAVVLPGAEAKALAPCRLDEVDLTVPYEGGGEIALVRHFNSFFRSTGPWGGVWTMDMPQLETVEAPISRTDKGVTFEMVRQLRTPLDSIHARFSKTATVPSLGAELPVPDVPSEILASAEAGNPMIPSASKKLIFKDGRRWYFDAKGRLAGIEQKPLTTLYVYDAEGRVGQIVGYNGDKVQATISLAYDKQGRLESAMGANSKGKEKVSFEYDVSGLLTGVLTAAGHVGYSYAGSRVMNVSFSARDKGGTLGKARDVRSFEYASNGQLLGETNADGTRLSYQVEQQAGGSRIVITPPSEPASAQVVTYDERSRPLEWTRPDGTRTRSEYAADGAVKTETTFPSGEFVRTGLSADGKRKTLETSGKILQSEDYDENGRLLGVSLNQKQIFRQHWHPDGTLKSVDYETHSVVPMRDRTGRITKVSKGKPTKDGQYRVLQEAELDEAGRVTSVKDGTGRGISVGYDQDNRIGSLITRMDGRDYGFTVKRLADGKVEKIHSSCGDEDFQYDAKGDLERVVARLGQATAESQYAGGKLKSITQFDKGRVQFAYYDGGESKGRLKSIQTPVIELGYQYAADGELNQVDCGRICRVNYERNASGDIEGLVLTPGDNSMISRAEARSGSKPGGSRGLAAAEASEFARLYREVVANPRMLGVFTTPRRIGSFKILEAHASFTDSRAFRVVDESGNHSFVKVQPNDPKGLDAKEAQAAVKMAKYFREEGVQLPEPLAVQAENGGEILITRDFIFSREELAGGVQLSELARRQQGRLTPEQEDMYIDATLNMAVRCKGLPNAIAAKESVTTIAEMRSKLSKRAGESRECFEVYAQTKLFREKFGSSVAAKGGKFDGIYSEFIKHFWKGEEPLQQTGLVHDAILPNYFLDGDKLTIIDVGSDYVGSMGHVLSIIATQLQQPGQTYSDYKTRIEGLMGSHEGKLGRKLSEAERTEITMHLSVQPYKMLSSDSGRMLSQVKRACGLPANATEAELAKAMRMPGNLRKVEEFLADPGVREKYERYMLNLEHSLMLFDERLPTSQSEDKRILNDLIKQVRDVRVAGLRVVVLPGSAGPPLASAR